MSGTVYSIGPLGTYNWDPSVRLKNVRSDEAGVQADFMGQGNELAIDTKARVRPADRHREASGVATDAGAASAHGHPGWPGTDARGGTEARSGG